MKSAQKQLLALNTLGIILLCHWGNNNESNTSVTGDGKKPDINFYGTVVDNTGTSVKANDITIGGMYRQIPVYVKPKNLNQKDYNPADNIARLDLAEISQISIGDPEKIYTFVNRTYIEIHVLSNDKKTTNTYIIETTKKLFFNEANESGPIEREVALNALQEVNIRGYKEPEKEELFEKKASKNNDLSSNTHNDSDVTYLDKHHAIIPPKKPVIVPGL